VNSALSLLKIQGVFVQSNTWTSTTVASSVHAPPFSPVRLTCMIALRLLTTETGFP